MPSLGDRLKGLKASITGQPPPPPEELTLPQTLLRQVDAASTLTWKQRAAGFGITFALGLLLTFLSLTFLWTLQLTSFAILYSLGNILSIASTMFLMGPVTQFKRMCESGRMLATTVYLGSIIATLCVAFLVGNVLLVLMCIIIQTVALFWYCITWIPGAQNFLKSLIFK